MADENVYVGRTYKDAPNVDGLIFVHTDADVYKRQGNIDKMRSLLILGAGGMGRMMQETALQLGYEDIAFLDDAKKMCIRDSCMLLCQVKAP